MDPRASPRSVPLRLCSRPAGPHPDVRRRPGGEADQAGLFKGPPASEPRPSERRRSPALLSPGCRVPIRGPRTHRSHSQSHSHRCSAQPLTPTPVSASARGFAHLQRAGIAARWHCRELQQALLQRAFSQHPGACRFRQKAPGRVGILVGSLKIQLRELLTTPTRGVGDCVVVVGQPVARFVYPYSRAQGARAGGGVVRADWTQPDPRLEFLGGGKANCGLQTTTCCCPQTTRRLGSTTIRLETSVARRLL